MSQQLQISRLLPRDSTELAIRACQLTVLFAIQGTIILVAYLAMGPPADLSRLPFGLRLDPIHAVIHLLAGLAGAYVGFFRPSAAFPFLRGFSAFYLILAILGTFTSIHFGMHLQTEENIFHWTVGAITAIIGFGLVPAAAFRRAES
jgi:lysylphosphatidylglycerol synthetase-like protein (DUF2156 family)